MAEKVWNVDEINAKLRELSEFVLTPGLVLYYASIDEAAEQDVNPRTILGLRGLLA